MQDAEARSLGRIARLRAGNDVLDSFLSTPRVVIAAAVALLMILTAVLAPLIAPHDPFDMAAISLLDSELPPAFLEGGDARFLLGTDSQGRDVFSAILHGLRISLMVGVVAVLLSMALGVTVGLVSGYFGGFVDSVLMRLADVILSFPTILIALLVNGILRGVLPSTQATATAVLVLVLSIAVNEWVQYARTVRGSTMVEKGKEYVKAARLTGLPPRTILRRHVLPNILSPVLVLATINLALAILTEATLSFLGVGMPPTQPSLGTLINTGNEFLFSGIWWVVVFPALTLVVLVLSVNIVGDWLRDALNPHLR
ncbi:ABC transporter permease [Marinimicrococcus flavescens]|uniref:ABC transporter permease n=1 Tax=Marinimicrococcus flavescens TaxID=3031815 RepID=A0AAP3UXE8_9PROT|nr:ABC transporter permease [Marinimicrococcus flavescens]